MNRRVRPHRNALEQERTPVCTAGRAVCTKRVGITLRETERVELQTTVTGASGVETFADILAPRSTYAISNVRVTRRDLDPESKHIHLNTCLIRSN